MRDWGKDVARAALRLGAAAWLAAIGLAPIAQAQDGMPSAQAAGLHEGGLQASAAAAGGRIRPWSTSGTACSTTRAYRPQARPSCASCHFSDLAWATEDPKSRNDSGKPTSRRSQTLLGIGYSAGPIGWDGRSATLEAQAKSSIATGSMSMSQTDTPVKVEAIEARVRAVPEYVAMLNAAMPGAELNLDAIAKAIAAFERTIEPGIAPFDRWIEGDARRHFGVGQCADSCCSTARLNARCATAAGASPTTRSTTSAWRRRTWAGAAT